MLDPLPHPRELIESEPVVLLWRHGQDAFTAGNRLVQEAPVGIARDDCRPAGIARSQQSVASRQIQAAQDQVRVLTMTGEALRRQHGLDLDREQAAPLGRRSGGRVGTPADAGEQPGDKCDGPE